MNDDAKDDVLTKYQNSLMKIEALKLKNSQLEDKVAVLTTRESEGIASYKRDIEPRLGIADKAERKGKRERIRKEASDTRARELASITDDSIKGLMRSVQTRNGVELVHTLESAKAYFRGEGVSCREIEVKAYCSSLIDLPSLVVDSFSHVIDMRVFVAGYATPVDWGTDTRIVLPTRLDRSMSWVCLLYEEGSSERVCWIVPELVGVSDEFCVSLSELGLSLGYGIHGPIDLLSEAIIDGLTITARSQREEWNEQAEIYAEAESEKAASKVANELAKSHLSKACEDLGLLDRDWLYFEYEDFSLAGSSTMTAQERWDASHPLDGSGGLADADPRSRWNKLSPLVERLSSVVSLGKGNGKPTLEVSKSLIMDALASLKRTRGLREKMQDLAWLAYCAGMKQAEEEFDQDCAQLVRTGKQFGDKHRPEGRYNHTQLIRKYVEIYYAEKGTYPAYLQFVEYAKDAMGDDYRYVKGPLEKNRNALRAQVRKLKDETSES